jgi:hypothetical protein
MMIIGRLLWLLTMISTALAAVGYLVIRAISREISAPQEAALAATTLVWAVVPYVLARAWDQFTAPGSAEGADPTKTRRRRTPPPHEMEGGKGTRLE